MSKDTTFFICNNCSYKTLKWLGCCPTCNILDSFIQETTVRTKNNKPSLNPALVPPQPLVGATGQKKERIFSGISEWDRVLGGGIVSGSFIVLTGDPGIGKSTLLLQVCGALAKNHSVLYVSTEESIDQIKQRAERIGILEQNLFAHETASFESIKAIVMQYMPEFLIIDSIQNCYTEMIDSSVGNIQQIRTIIFELMRICKEKGITIIITSHITKEGIIAGPKTLEHMVDAVFYLQGDDDTHTRMLLSVKNRFGSLQELGFFRMESHGFVEIPNINEDTIKSHVGAIGSVLVSTTEGTRPLLLELQALTIASPLTFPQRIISGVEHKQVTLIAAILEKYLKIRFSAHDIFFKISGGLKTKSNAIDLGIALALLSSYFQKPFTLKTLACGEISLTGNIKSISKLTPFIKEAHKCAIEQLVVARSQHPQQKKLQVYEVEHVVELLSLFN